MRQGRNLIGGVAALIFFWAGITMIGIRSVSGDSVAEAVYQAFGIFSLGLGAATIAFMMTAFTVDDHRTTPAASSGVMLCQEVVGKAATRIDGSRERTTCRRLRNVVVTY
jgi:hypothetical protein